MERSKHSQEEIVVRLLNSHRGEWLTTHELIKRETEWGYLGSRVERRAFELAAQGYYDSPNNRYYIEARGPHKRGNPTRFTQFRVTQKVIHNTSQLLEWSKSAVREFDKETV